MYTDMKYMVNITVRHHVAPLILWSIYLKLRRSRNEDGDCPFMSRLKGKEGGGRRLENRGGYAVLSRVRAY